MYICLCVHVNTYVCTYVTIIIKKSLPNWKSDMSDIEQIVRCWTESTWEGLEKGMKEGK